MDTQEAPKQQKMTMRERVLALMMVRMGIQSGEDVVAVIGLIAMGVLFVALILALAGVIPLPTESSSYWWPF